MNPDVNSRISVTHSILLLLLFSLGVCLGLLLRLLPGLFLLFELFYSGVTVVGGVCRDARTHFKDAPTQLLLTIKSYLLRTYQLVFLICSSPPSSSALWKPGSAFQSISARLG